MALHEADPGHVTAGGTGPGHVTAEGTGSGHVTAEGTDLGREMIGNTRNHPSQRRSKSDHNDAS